MNLAPDLPGHFYIYIAESMGQVQSGGGDGDDPSARQPEQKPSRSPSNSEPASMESLIEEAMAYGNDGNESLDVKAQKALDCPCVARLRSGPCGTQFSDAFLCFFKSTAEEKGSDCVNPLVALQKCIKANPDAFSKDVLDDEDEAEKEEETSREYRINPPEWAAEPRSSKAKL